MTREEQFEAAIPPDIDPITKGLIDRLPKAGAVWSASQRKLWLQILKNWFELVYQDEQGSDHVPGPEQ